MNHKRKNFIVLNEPFVCIQCGFDNDILDKGCRNHCRKCLYSMHLDQYVPGDRESHCVGIMKPVSLDQHSKKGQMIVHECLTCGKRIRNMSAPDDDIDALINIMLQP